MGGRWTEPGKKRRRGGANRWDAGKKDMKEEGKKEGKTRKRKKGNKEQDIEGRKEEWQRE